MFYTCKLLPTWSSHFRVAIDENVYAFIGPPCGWPRSSTLAKEHLGLALTAQFPRSTLVIQYNTLLFPPSTFLVSNFFRCQSGICHPCPKAGPAERRDRLAMSPR